MKKATFKIEYHIYTAYIIYIYKIEYHTYIHTYISLTHTQHIALSLHHKNTRYPEKAEKFIRCPGPGFTGSSVPSDVGAKNQPWLPNSSSTIKSNLQLPKMPL